MQIIPVTTPGPLLDVLAAAVGNRTRVKQWLKARKIAVNGATAERHDQPLTPGDRVEVGPPRAAPTPPSGLTVVYEDADLIVIDKPAGLLTVATDREKADTAYYKVTERYKAKGGRAFIVHRLDRETSGLLVLARTEPAKRTLQANWPLVEKHYFAVVAGVPAKPADTIVAHLTETAAYRVFAGPPAKDAKPAVTHYQVLKAGKYYSLLDVRTETGRKHQIRVHLASRGHPIVGDDRYGGDRGVPRLGLHASSLAFPHPTTGETLSFQSPLPAALAKAVR